MLLDNIVNNKEPSYIYMERYVNDGSPSGFDRVHTSSEKTSPRGSNDSFELLIIQFNEDIEIRSIGEETNIIGDRCFFCHPDNIANSVFNDIKDLWEVVGSVRVAPTSSSRTVKVLGKDYFVKLDYLGLLGRFRRNLDYQHLLSAYEVTRDICDGIVSGAYNDRFGLLTENNGRVAYLPLKSGGFYEFGYLIRDAKPFSRNDNEELFLIPGFSLFSKDMYVPNAEPILLQLYRCSGMDINEFAFNDIIGPIIDCYFDALTNHGLAMESHSQNTLFAIDSDCKVKLLVSRDMESVDKDIPLREFLKVKSKIESQSYKCIRKTDYNYTIKHSFMYDFKLGEYLITPIIDTFDTVKGFNREFLIGMIKNKSASYIEKLPQGYFPSTWYNYANEIFEGSERPYISNENPKYR